ncbi:hypothetical protein CIB48_g2516 [Xylaria polymorpha]|nr:hypothetical protein CIB48_g2516 [Xylaria polymorpha]
MSSSLSSSSSSSSSSAAPASPEETAAEIQRSFSASQLWEFEQFIGNGMFGVVVLLRDKNPLLPSDQRRVVLKQPIRDEDGHDELLKEIKALKRLRGSYHIAQLLASCEDVAAANSSTSSGLGILGTPLSTVFETLKESRIKGPAVLLEEPLGLAHGDIALRNIMVGDRDPIGHPELPQLKLIDFGCTTVRGTALSAIRENISNVSILIGVRTQTDRTGVTYAEFSGIRTMAKEIVPQPGSDPFPHLDHELRDLIIHATAVKPEDRPSLEEMLRRTEQGMRKLPYLYLGQELEESDNSIEEIIQAVVFNA